jgi:hypothetical protein
VETHFGSFRDSANLDAQYVHGFCAEHTIGSEIVLNAPNGTLRCMGNVESHFGPFEDSVSVGAR